MGGSANRHASPPLDIHRLATKVQPVPGADLPKRGGYPIFWILD